MNELGEDLSGLRALPPWSAVVAVVAHPDDESFGLGAVISSFIASGARVSVLCFTLGEATTIGCRDDIRRQRAHELVVAATALGVRSTFVHTYRDGELALEAPKRLVADVVVSARDARAAGLLVFDTHGITGHPDHVAATGVALDAAYDLELPVLGWTLPSGVAASLNAEFGTTFSGRLPHEIDFRIRVDRAQQRAAIAAHASQAVPTSPLWRRLELLADLECLRWLSPAD